MDIVAIYVIKFLSILMILMPLLFTLVQVYITVLLLCLGEIKSRKEFWNRIFLPVYLYKTYKNLPNGKDK